MARHRRRRGPRRTRTEGGRGRLAVAALVVALAAAGSAALIGPGLARDCPHGRRVLTVSATPELAPVLAQRARDATRPGAGEDCWAVDLTPRASADVLADLRRGTGDLPDVWVPDSSMWVRLAARSGVRVAGRAGPLAVSPVVLALPAGSAARVVENGGSPAYGQLLATGGTARPLRTGWPDPRRSAPALAALLGLQAAGGADSTGRSDLAGLMAAARTGLPPTTAARLGASRLALPVPEQSVWAYNATTSRPVVAAYSSAPGTVLDYPFVVLETRPETTTAAAALLAALTDRSGQALLRSRGFRDASGEAGSALADVPGLDPSARPGTRTPTAADLVSVRGMLGTLRHGTRMLAVMDVSGSMASAVPGTGGLDRLEVAQRAATAALALLPATARVGLWEFSTDLTPLSDHRVVVPLGPAGRQRAALAAGLAGMRAVPGGSTGLYDTTLAAVRRMRDSYDPTRTNAVVLLTDGANQDPNGIGLAALLDRLRSESDPARPVPVVAVAYGPDGDAAALRAISDATGGATYQAVDPRDVRRVLLDAIGQRLCRPDCAEVS